MFLTGYKNTFIYDLDNKKKNPGGFDKLNHRNLNVMQTTLFLKQI